MPGGKERALRQRIKSVRATRKITKAMELIAASQIARAQARITANRPYRDGLRRLVAEAAAGDARAAAEWTGEPAEVQTVAVLVVVGDRGLSGPYNSSLLRAAERLIGELRRANRTVQVFTVGKKAPAYFRFRNLPLTRSFQGISDRPTFSDAHAVAAPVAQLFLDHEVHEVQLVAMSFRSAGSQAVHVRQVLPLVVDDELAQAAAHGGYTEFEPEPAQLFEELVPAVLESELYAALLEGAASFHTSQQRAMAAATENADELARTLTRVMNQARQDAITTEIMEVVGGAEALRAGKREA